jgi:hypothetical protein
MQVPTAHTATEPAFVTQAAWIERQLRPANVDAAHDLHADLPTNCCPPRLNRSRIGTCRPASIRELESIGVTRGPGLVGSLMVGINSAAGLGHAGGVPVVGVNYLRGHLRSADLEERRVRQPAMVCSSPVGTRC